MDDFWRLRGTALESGTCFDFCNWSQLDETEELFDAGLDVIKLSPMGRKSIKDYDEKLLVVVNPWPPSGPTHRQFVNNVASWFEVMLGKSNGIKVEAVYQQRTHHYIIVELPAEAGTDRLIGAHHWSDFLVEPWKSKHQETVSYIYEYNYQVFRHPSQINWHAAIPTYSSIDPSFPIRSPYPPPRPAPSTSLPYAAALPPQLRLVNKPPPHEQSEIINHEIPSNPEAVTHACAKLSKKDPYDQEEEAVRALLVQSSIPEKIDGSRTNEDKPTCIKAEADLDDYEPSPELVSLLSHYGPTAEEKPACIKAEDLDKYEPSPELVSLLSQYRDPKRSPKRRNADDDRPTKRVKKEYS